MSRPACSRQVLPELSTRRVLTTEWVVGERLDTCPAEDVPRLCSVAMVAYLRMMLDTGVLHCDPHPGNLLRTTDGQLCILDWGMTLGVPQDLQCALGTHRVPQHSARHAQPSGHRAQLSALSARHPASIIRQSFRKQCFHYGVLTCLFPKHC